MTQVQSKETEAAFDVVDFIMRVEGGETMTYGEYVDGMQRMIDSGMVWQLQGSWGRAAMELIREGSCHA